MRVHQLAGAGCRNSLPPQAYPDLQNKLGSRNKMFARRSSHGTRGRFDGGTLRVLLVVRDGASALLEPEEEQCHSNDCSSNDDDDVYTSEESKGEFEQGTNEQQKNAKVG